MEKVFRGKWSKEKKVDKWKPRRSTYLSFMAFLDFVDLPVQSSAFHFISVNVEGRQVGAKKIDRFFFNSLFRLRILCSFFRPSSVRLPFIFRQLCRPFRPSPSSFLLKVLHAIKPILFYDQNKVAFTTTSTLVIILTYVRSLLKGLRLNRGTPYITVVFVNR